MHKTIVTITILSEGPVSPEATLEGIAHQIVEGDWSGNVHIGASRAISAPEMALELMAQGSDPSFLLGEDYEGVSELESQKKLPWPTDEPPTTTLGQMESGTLKVILGQKNFASKLYRKAMKAILAERKLK